MKNTGVEINYGNVAVGAKEDFVATTYDKAPFVDLSQLQYHNLDVKNYGNPCERNSVVLDGKAIAFPSNPETTNLGLWSESISTDLGSFEEPIVLTLISDEQYASQGLTFTFDVYNQIYPTHINIHWWRDVDGEETDLGEKDFYPDKAQYFCYNLVNNYNRIVITFYSLNMPNNRLKLRSIDYGYGTIFRGDELRSVKNIQEINPISSEISINTSDFTLDSKADDIEYSFQAKQPLSIYFNGELKSTIFIKKATRKSRRLWQVQGEDYIGLMDSIPYYGGIYNNAKAIDVLDDIFATAKVPFTIDDEFVETTVTGYIPYGSCRDALMQVAFAIQAVVDTSNRSDVAIYGLDDDIKQTVPKKRIMQGQSFVDEETITGVEVTYHTYKPIAETIDVYSAEDSGTGQNIFVTFSEPLYDLTIVNGEIVNNGANYAVINANANCVLRGKKYEHTTSAKRKNNPVVLAGDIEKIASVENATLVSSNNIDNVLEKCYNWIVQTNTINADIVEGKHVQYGDTYKYGEHKYGTFKYGQKQPNIVTYDAPVNVGDNIKVETEYLGVVQGRVIKQTFNLNGGIIIKKTIMKGAI